MLKESPELPASAAPVIEADKIAKLAERELVEVFGAGSLNEEIRQQAKYYVAGLWPFRRISFECPGCSRWLSVKVSHSGRNGFCPSCDLTVAAPDLETELPASLISRSKLAPSVKAKNLPQGRLLKSDDSEYGPKRMGGIIDQEEGWGIKDDDRPVPISIVTRYQAFVPWIALVVLLVAGVLSANAFMATQNRQDKGQPMAVEPAQTRPKVPLGSELWVVLDSLATAEHPDEMVALVRKPDEMLPHMREFYNQSYSIEKLPHRFERTRRGVKVYEIGGKRFARFEGRCDGRPVKFSFEETQYGWRLDWESMIGHNPTNWRKFLDGGVEGQHSFRVLAGISTDSNIEYDRQKYICLRLTDHLETGMGFALLERHGGMAMKLRKFLDLTANVRHAGARTWLTPVLERHEETGLLEIVGLRSASWLIP